MRATHLRQTAGLALALAALSTMISVRAQDRPPAGAATAGQPRSHIPTIEELANSTDPAAQTFRRVCTQCHPPDRIFEVRRTGAEWEEEMMKMLTKGAQGTENELQMVFFYLVQNCGKVYINSAQADEIAGVLALPPEAGQAIVRYRGQNGPFKDFAALSKVPGIDLSHVVPDSVVY
jgi:competence ComEA-like helix-hairpin-helix protein